eukprot:CAMPEP_0201978590 /NCGR_PEP_ID=MMETSP0904-20121228/64498_1 /ASSEMBLY_ACC=CAM_ASM_000553 /TAXON_ID=420261 /ORGANISM="Thalassiosira antarctica, Strain CCMP982" /LENGTH=49 /DNA_ID= /DNA_START= /DNA_END= /DNA_ORIENTATION=
MSVRQNLQADIATAPAGTTAVEQDAAALKLFDVAARTVGVKIRLPAGKG